MNWFLADLAVREATVDTRERGVMDGLPQLDVESINIPLRISEGKIWNRFPRRKIVRVYAHVIRSKNSLIGQGLNGPIYLSSKFHVNSEMLSI